MNYGKNALLALSAINGVETVGIPTWLHQTMQHDQIEYFAGAAKGDYEREPERVYNDYMRNCGVCLLDQYIPRNPLTMGSRGYTDDAKRGVTTGKHDDIVLDGIIIKEPEDVIEHLVKFINPAIKAAIINFDSDAHIKALLENEKSVQQQLGYDILKNPYGFVSFPYLYYFTYGYEYYLMAYALYPEMMEENFKLQADFATIVNTAVAKAYKMGNLPQLMRLDHDIADSRSTLVDIKSLDKIWFPHFSRCIEPLVKAGIKTIWHCDGNLSQMVPRLLDCGLAGFQGFQYEDGMDYKKIAAMKTRNGDDLFIIAGISVTTTLPFGTPADIKAEFKFLVENGPEKGLVLGCTSSITPGVPLENLIALEEGFKYYRENGRK